MRFIISLTRDWVWLGYLWIVFHFISFSLHVIFFSSLHFPHCKGNCKQKIIIISPMMMMMTLNLKFQICLWGLIDGAALKYRSNEIRWITSLMLSHAYIFTCIYVHWCEPNVNRILPSASDVNPERPLVKWDRGNLSNWLACFYAPQTGCVCVHIHQQNDRGMKKKNWMMIVIIIN
jgi:hypothetical protein